LKGYQSAETQGEEDQEILQKIFHGLP
jgi:hypothetical protein